MNRYISIIVAVYNVEDYIDSCVLSILNQSYRNFELILVDDGSTDNSGRICDEYKMKDRRVKVIHQKNSGVSTARNNGLKISNGELIFFVDSDDLIHYSTLEIMLEEYIDNTKMVVCGFERFDSNTHCDVNYKYNNQISFNLFDVSQFLIKRTGYYSWGILYEKSIIEQYNIFFDKDLGNLEDVVWNAIYLAYIKYFVFIDLPLYKYRIRANSITRESCDHLLQAYCNYKSYNSIKTEKSKRALSTEQKKVMNYIMFTCLNALCGELIASDNRLTKFILKYKCKFSFCDYIQLIVRYFTLKLRIIIKK